MCLETITMDSSEQHLVVSPDDFMSVSAPKRCFHRFAPARLIVGVSCVIPLHFTGVII